MSEPRPPADGAGGRPPPGPLRVQFEVIPLPGIAERALAQLPPGSRVTVTASPAQGLEATLGTAARLAAGGMVAIPHLAARRVRGGAQLEEIVSGLGEAGIEELFVIAGDAAEPAGPFPGALELLEALDPVRRGLTVGIGTHPEGHPFLAPDAALERLRRTAPHASWMSTQMLFEPGPLLDWLGVLGEAGITLPVRPGIAAPASRAQLLRIGSRIGVGRSLRMLTTEGSGVRHLLSPGRWDPDPLLQDLAQSDGPSLAAPHVFTFNDLEATASWWGGRAG